MPGELIPSPDTLAARIARAEHDARGADAPATRQTYEGATKPWADWCEGRGLAVAYPADPRTLGAWIDAMAAKGRAPATLRTYFAELNRAHRHLPPPGEAAVVRLALQRLVRAAAATGPRQG